MSRTTFGSLPWRSRSQHDLAAKSSPAHNFVIWNWISKIFYRNDHHIQTMCRAQNLGRYLEGQGHSITLQQNRVRPITSLFEVGFRNYFTEMITILRWCVARNIWVSTLKVKVKAWPCSKIMSWPITLLFKVIFRNNFTEMITILRRHVTFKIWAATLKVKVTAWPFSKIVSGP